MPLSLGGNHVPRVVSPTHHQQDSPTHHPHLHHVTRDDTSVPSKPSMVLPLPMGRRGSDGSRSSRDLESTAPPLSGEGGGKSVNQLMGMFQEQTHGSPNHPSSPIRTRPVPPVKKKTPQMSKPPSQATNKVSPVPRPTPQSTAATETSKPPPSPAAKMQGASKVPLFPPNGKVNIAKTNSVDTALSKQPAKHSKDLPTGQKHGGKHSLPLHSKDTPLHSKDTPLHGKDTPLHGKDKEESSGNNPGSSHSNAASSGASVMQRIKNFSSSSSSNDLGLHLRVGKGKLSDFTTSYTPGPDKQALDFVDRRRADSADKIKNSPKKIHAQPVKPVAGNSKTPLHSDAPPVPKTLPTQSHVETRARPTQYENVAMPHNKGPGSVSGPLKPLPYQSLSQGDAADYDNLTFTNRDSDVYENISIGFAGSGEEGSLTGPLPPLPLSRNPVNPQPLRLSYENVEIGGGKSKGGKGGKPKHTVGGKASSGGKQAAEEGVVEDDDTLFGKEGPPGMQVQETIYENFGPDKGNKLMTIDELAAHVEKLGKAGLSTEYYRIRNEPITGTYKACR